MTVRPIDIWRLKLLLVIVATMALIAMGGRAVAQMRQAEQLDREERRLDRKIEGLQKDLDDLKLGIERRLVRIETQMEAGVWLIAVIAGILLLGVGERAMSLIMTRRAAHAPKIGEAP